MMEQLDMLIICGAILMGISLLLLLILITRWLFLVSKQKKIKRAKSKSRKKKSRERQNLLLNSQALKTTGQSLLLVGLLCLFSGGASGYAYYYQQTNLNAGDQENLSEATLYVAEVDSLIETIADGKEEEKKQANIREMASHMSSYSFKKGDFRAPSDVQIILNRYYKEVGQLGVNLANETVEHLKNDGELIETYKKDIIRITTIEKKIYEFYGLKKPSV